MNKLFEQQQQQQQPRVTYTSLCSRSGDKGRRLHGHTEIPNLHAEIINLPDPVIIIFFLIHITQTKEHFLLYRRH